MSWSGRAASSRSPTPTSRPRRAGRSPRMRTTRSPPDSGAAADDVSDARFEPVDQYAAMVDAFARSVAAGALVDPAEDGLAQMIVLDRLKQAARRPAEAP